MPTRLPPWAPPADTVDLLVQPAEALAATYGHELARATARLEGLEAAAAGRPAADDLLPALDALLRQLDMAQGTASLLRNVRPERAARESAAAAEQGFQALATRLRLSRPLFAALEALDLAGACPATRRWVERACREARRAGVGLPEAERQRAQALQEKLTALGQAFDAHIAGDTRTVEVRSLDGLPDDYRAAHPPDARGIARISTASPDAVPWMTYAHDDDARRRLFVAQRQRATPANLPLLAEILSLRQELARLLGFAHWADYATEDKMVGSAEAAGRFLDELWRLAGPRATRDARALAAAAGEAGLGPGPVQEWQRGYLQEAVRRREVGLDAREARPYFRLGRVREGLFRLTGEMFGLVFTPAPVPVWHPDVEAFDVADEAGPLGRFFLDLHPRPDKFQHAAAFPLRVGVAGGQLPEAALVCNFPKGAEAWLEHNDVRTLFHEFGHLLHHLMAGRQKWAALGGIACEWDFVEAPSQLLEEWTYDPETLRTFAVRADGTPIPDALVEKMRCGRRLGAGIMVRVQVFYAAVSLELHRREAGAIDTGAVVRELQARYSPFPHVEGCAFEASFGHLEGYSALYYTYLWSQVIGQDLFGAFLAEGLRAPAVWQRYRADVLAPGGSLPASAMIRAFLGRDFHQGAFAAWLDADG